MKFKQLLLENDIINQWKNNSIEQDNKFRYWLKTQPEALKEVENIKNNAKNISDNKKRIQYIKKEKHNFDTKWIAIWKTKNEI